MNNRDKVEWMDSINAGTRISNSIPEGYTDYATATCSVQLPYGDSKRKEIKMSDVFYFHGEAYTVRDIEVEITSFRDSDLIIHASKSMASPSQKIYDAKKKNKFEIKKIFVNPEKSATTVLWADGTHTIVKRSEGDNPADIWSVVSYALAEKIYGSNSALKREIKGKVEKQSKKR